MSNIEYRNKSKKEVTANQTSVTEENSMMAAAASKAARDNLEIHSPKYPNTIGRVINCERLRVRMEPSLESDVVCLIDSNTKLMIDNSASTDEWFKVYNIGGLEGFCMKRFISINR